MIAHQPEAADEERETRLLADAAVMAAIDEARTNPERRVRAPEVAR